MYILQLNDASKWNITGNVEKMDVRFDGEIVSAIKFQVTDSTADAIKTAFKDVFNTREMSQYSEDNAKMANFIGYTKCKSIARDEVLFDDTQTEVFEVVMMQPSDLTDTVKYMETKINSLEQQLITLTSEPDPTKMELSELKEYLVVKSKTELEEYLLINPITSKCHGGVEKQYSITGLKQQYLNQAIALASIAKTNGDITYQPSWNAEGEPCTYDWTLDELVQLAFEINTVVRPLITKQQELEAMIMACTNTADALAVLIDYSVVAAEA